MKRKLPSVGLEERFPHDYDTSFHWRVVSKGLLEKADEFCCGTKFNLNKIYYVDFSRGIRWHDFGFVIIPFLEATAVRLWTNLEATFMLTCSLKCCDW